MNEIELLPDVYLRRKLARRHSRRNLIWALAVMASLGLLYAGNTVRLETASAALQQYEEDRVYYRNQKACLQDMHARLANLQGRRRLVESLDDHAPLDLVFAELTRHLSDSMSIRTLTVETLESEPTPTPDGGESTGESEQGIGSASNPRRERETRIVVTGAAPGYVEIGIYYGTLSHSPLFASSELHDIVEIVENRRRVQRFEMSFVLNAVSIVEQEGP